MTAKEKADELIHKYILNTPVGFHFDDAKQCALIAVDEILDVIEDPTGKEIKYWKEVKKEIEKI
ncbi:hypothetical protein UFOVP618_55 [uncultured Caudovirales phage]|uniref:Uncharacterized protein n=1 Tax=uncultured Caudovirales phage TaxID=2100421 RepID=A0A6J5N7T4_9CAUD|nr:hypothetical protein UFOVP618_55 [uncultured Caudovirales phage]